MKRDREKNDVRAYEDDAFFAEYINRQEPDGNDNREVVNEEPMWNDSRDEYD